MADCLKGSFRVITAGVLTILIINSVNRDITFSNAHKLPEKASFFCLQLSSHFYQLLLQYPVLTANAAFLSLPHDAGRVAKVARKAIYVYYGILFFFIAAQ